MMFNSSYKTYRLQNTLGLKMLWAKMGSFVQ